MQAKAQVFKALGSESRFSERGRSGRGLIEGLRDKVKQLPDFRPPGPEPGLRGAFIRDDNRFADASRVENGDTHHLRCVSPPSPEPHARAAPVPAARPGWRYLRRRSTTPATLPAGAGAGAGFFSALGFLCSLLDRFWPLAMVCSFARGASGGRAPLRSYALLPALDTAPAGKGFKPGCAPGAALAFTEQASPTRE